MKGVRLYPLALAFLLGLALAQDGKALYGQHCAACHGAEGQGIPGAIPPLAGNPRVADEAYVVKVVREGLSGPLEVKGVAYSGVMPPMPQVAEADARAIAQYLKGLSGASAQPPAPAPQVQGDPALGRALYLGQKALQNGGAPCQACHTVAGVGFLGGGSLGRDLTDAAKRLGGEAGLRAVLQNPAFLVMREAYKDKPLTEVEAAALAAFLVQVSQEAPRPASLYQGRFLVAGLVLLGLLLLYQAILWQMRPQSLAERIRSQLRR
ncbi:c-type cytochrome [Thermus igniterrae]|jgi:ubiquinol-cytochrome c reductase cytochrome c subunit|uniref:c-type cytochrome n=1 Tax=Thermus igniterrae TaxID=88189 RepID=UPI00037E55A5|nr:c-type cytochrome [Thermus igniterrae]